VGRDREIAPQRGDNRESGEVFKKGFSGHRGAALMTDDNDIENKNGLKANANADRCQRNRLKRAKVNKMHFLEFLLVLLFTCFYARLKLSELSNSMHRPFATSCALTPFRTEKRLELLPQSCAEAVQFTS
jgi:hypothetical protein